MNIVMTLLVRDEQDIIAENIEFHRSQGVDLFIVTDNLSIDKTPSILKKYEQKGYLKIINETSDDYSQHKWVTRMASMAFSEYNADWIIHSDADEFWMPNQKKQNLKSILAPLPDSIFACKANRVNYLPPRASDSNIHFLESMQIREAKSYNAIGQPLPPKICHRGHNNITISQGNHHVAINNKKVPPIEIPITIHHYPIRSFAQFENKIKKGGAAYERNTTLDKCIGSTWRDLYQQYLSGKLHEYYWKQIPNEATLKEGLSSNTLIEDSHLYKYFSHKLKKSIDCEN